MARGWGKSEEDLGADREHASEARRAAGSGTRQDAARRMETHSIELSLARIEEQLAKTRNDSRRRALEAARQELRGRLALLVEPPAGDAP